MSNGCACRPSSLVTSSLSVSDHFTTLATLTLNPSSHLPAAQTPGHRRHYALAKIKRIGSRHPCWPPAPASILNQKSHRLGILKSDSALMNLTLARIGDMPGFAAGLVKLRSCPTDRHPR